MSVLQLQRSPDKSEDVMWQNSQICIGTVSLKRLGIKLDTYNDIQPLAAHFIHSPTIVGFPKRVVQDFKQSRSSSNRPCINSDNLHRKIMNMLGRRIVCNRIHRDILIKSPQNGSKSGVKEWPSKNVFIGFPAGLFWVLFELGTCSKLRVPVPGFYRTLTKWIREDWLILVDNPWSYE